MREKKQRAKQVKSEPQEMLLRRQTGKKSPRKSLKKSSETLGANSMWINKDKGEQKLKEKRMLNNAKCHQEPKWNQG